MNAWDIIYRPWIITPAGLAVAIVQVLCPDPLERWIVGSIGVLVVGIGVGLWIARWAEPEPPPEPLAWRNLKKLGVTQVCLKTTDDAENWCGRFRRAREIRMIVVKATTFLQNHRDGIIDALANGCKVTVLMATPGSELVHEMEGRWRRRIATVVRRR